MYNVRHMAAALLLAIGFSAFAADPEIAIEKRGDVFVIDATIDFPAPLRTAWDVLTDFDHMVGVLSNLTQSKITGQTGNKLQVHQEGTAKYGLFSYSFESDREIRLKPMRKINARQISGNTKSFFSVMELSENGTGTRGRYHAEVVPDSGIARTFGGPFIQHEIEEQFSAMVAEMLRRKALQLSSTLSPSGNA